MNEASTNPLQDALDELNAEITRLRAEVEGFAVARHVLDRISGLVLDAGGSVGDQAHLDESVGTLMQHLAAEVERLTKELDETRVGQDRANRNFLRAVEAHEALMRKAGQ
ncbi:MAG: hypothetical protein V2A71_04490 [Candidatus Eisenbacteria bacterium]